MADETNEGPPPVERWWPPLDIRSKHRVLALVDDVDAEEDEDDVEVVLDDEILEAIADIVGTAAPVKLSRHERQYIRTQIEPVD
jgi:hypothetical protein